MSVTLANGSIAQTHLTRSWANRTMGFVVLALVGTAIMAIAAKIQVPFYPVPMNLQTLAVFGIAAAFGRNLAVATMLLYLLEGFAGLPVFAGPAAGPAYFTGPTAGYLAGFVIAAFIVGTAADKGWSQSAGKMFGAMLVADVIVFALGFAWLATLIGSTKAFEFGVAPFVLADILKIAIASLAVAGFWKVWKRS